MSEPGRFRRSYDRIAASYRERFEGELEAKAVDRSFLDAVSDVSPRNSWVVDLGSGPGQIGAYLASHGLRIITLDISFEMLRQCQDLLAGSCQIQADMRSVPLRSGSIGGIVAYYSVIHIPPAEVAGAIAEMRRVLTPGGHVAITTHVAPPADRAGRVEELPTGGLHVEEMLDASVDLDFFFYGVGRVTSALEEGGFRIIRSFERDPYAPEVEIQTRRAYVLARKVD
jgi:SAM-dependent methyltransferase